MSETEKLWNIYFQPGQIIFHVTGNFDGDPAALIKWANGLAEKKGVTISSPEVLTFETVGDSVSLTYPHQTKKARFRPAVVRQETKLPPFQTIFQIDPQAKAPPTFSLVSAKVENDNWPSFKAFKVGENWEEQLKQKKAFTELFELIVLLDRKRWRAPVKLKAITPNWLIGGGPSGPGSTGGPGGKPSSADASAASARTFNSRNAFFTRFPNRPGITPGEVKDVTVAILDTCFPEQRWREIKAAWTSHPIITSLLGTPGGAGGMLSVHPDSEVDKYLPDVLVDGHEYDMTDHGLFIAGIINHLAPKAELHLYQVLNSHGLGDLLQIAHTLDTIRKDFSDRLDKLFINMSLTLRVPLEEKHISKNDEIGQKILAEKHRGEQFWNLIHLICRILQWILRLIFPNLVLRCRGSWSDRQTLAFEWISDLVHVLGPGIIAAAGNDGSDGYRPAAYYPAAFDSVLGVGALSRGIPWNPSAPLMPATYSDLADTPTTQGVTAFGGEEGDGNGVPGVYVGILPDGTQNSTGWAWWAGTSFATPIISGLAAALVIDGKAVSARDAINTILGNPFDRTSVWEIIIPVEP